MYTRHAANPVQPVRYQSLQSGVRRSLSSTNGQMVLLYTSWKMVLRLALMHGWRDPVAAAAERARAQSPFAAEFAEPLPPFGAPGTTISGHDAAALSDVIEQSLPDIPGEDAMGFKICSSIDLPAWAARHVGRRALRMVRPGASVSPIEYFSGDNKRRLSRLVRVLRGGEVTVRPADPETRH